MELTLKKLLELSSEKSIEDFVSTLLITSGNPGFARTIKKGYCWLGPIELELSKLKRICGYEKGMLFPENKFDWNLRIQEMVHSIENGWDVPPLIIWYKDHELQISDGAHRYEALKKANFKKYWVIFWFKDKVDFNNFCEQYKKIKSHSKVYKIVSE